MWFTQAYDAEKHENVVTFHISDADMRDIKLDELDRAALSKREDTIADVAQNVQMLAFRYIQQQEEAALAIEAEALSDNSQTATGSDA